MGFYLNVENDKIVNCGNFDITSDTTKSYEVTEEVYYNYIKHEDRYLIENDEVVEDPEFITRLTAANKQNFENKFLATSKGNYRLQPKGYANAQQSVDTINNMVNALNGLPENVANMILFYPTPDFSKEEQCTEEWLIEHQIKSPAMTVQEFGQLYVNFMTAWNTSEHERLTRERERQANV